MNTRTQKSLGVHEDDTASLSLARLVDPRDLVGVKRAIVSIHKQEMVSVCLRMKFPQHLPSGPAYLWDIRKSQFEKQEYYVATGKVVPHLLADLERKGIPATSIPEGLSEWIQIEDSFLLFQPNGRIIFQSMTEEWEAFLGYMNDKFIEDHLAPDSWTLLKSQLAFKDRATLAPAFNLLWRHEGLSLQTKCKLISFTSDSQPIAWGLFMREETEGMIRTIEQQKAQIQAFHQEYNRFGVVLAHDIRAPLRAILAFTESVIVENEQILSEISLESLTHVLESTKQLHTLLTEAANYVKVGNKKLILDEVSVQDLIKEEIQNLQYEFPEQVIRLEIDDLPTAWGDVLLLRKVVQQILSNAVKFSRNEPVTLIEIGAIVQQDQIIFNFRDNGIGIDTDNQGRIFDLFAQLHVSEAYEGAGVGLALARRIVTIHGGRIWVESTEGAGSTFYVSLPAFPLLP